MTSMKDIPGTRTEVVHMTSHAAATASEKRIAFKAPYAITLTSVAFMVDVAVSGTDTDYTNLNLIDAGAAGAGTTEIGNKDFVSGTNLAANTATELLGTAGAGTDADLDSGDYLILQYEKVGNGLLIGAGALVINFIPKA